MLSPIYPDAQPSPTQPKKPSKAVTVIIAIGTIALAVLLFFAAQFIVTFLYMIVAVVAEVFELGLNESLLDPTSAVLTEIIEKVSEKTISNALLLSLVSNLLVLLTLCLTYTIRKKPVTEGLSLHSINPIRYVSIAIFGMALQVFIAVALAFIPLPSELIESHNTQYDVLSNSSIVVEILSAGLVTGIVEELVFRAIGTKQLKRFMHPTAAVIVSALIFGLVHPTLLSMVYATILGLILGALYIKYDSVVPCIICHVFFNSTSSLLGLITEETSVLLLIFFGVSIPVIIYLTKSLFFRYPTASDLLFDSKGRIKPRNSAEAEVIKEMNRLKESGSISEIDLHKIDISWERAKKAKPTATAKEDQSTADTNEENKGDSNTDEAL